MAAVERFNGQRLDVDDGRLESPRQRVHRGRMGPEKYDRFDGAHADGPEHSPVHTTRFVVLFSVRTQTHCHYRVIINTAAESTGFARVQVPNEKRQFSLPALYYSSLPSLSAFTYAL